VHGEQDRGEISRAYAEHRPYLIDLAFRMLGDIGTAEDTVQDAFWRLMHADLGEISDERGWLIVVTSRLCLDRIRSARSRRERAHDASEIEFVGPAVGAAQPPLADPADRVTFDDGVRLALLAMLQRLSPPEQLEGKQADTRTDIFAFGIVLFEMLTRRKDFAGNSQASLIAAIMNSDPP